MNYPVTTPRAVRGYAVYHPSGHLAGTYLAYNRDEVLRALRIEWGNSATCSMKVTCAPKNTVGEGGMQGDFHTDLTTKDGWDQLIPFAENGESGDDQGKNSKADEVEGCR